MTQIQDTYITQQNIYNQTNITSIQQTNIGMEFNNYNFYPTYYATPIRPVGCPAPAPQPMPAKPVATSAYTGIVRGR